MKSFTIMTYNVHSCIGRDGVASPERIAQVISQYDTDIVALQELDSGLKRTSGVNQSHRIAEHLNMNVHFQPTLEEKEGYYGNALMSRFPIEFVKAGELPTFFRRRLPERRGALWMKVSIDGREVQIINTHLGLNRRERLAQADTLLGPEWLRNPLCRPPIVFCGDLNATPWSAVYRQFSNALRNAHEKSNRRRPRNTWHSALPFLSLDHVFVSRDISVTSIHIPKTPLTKAASDHLPLIVKMKLTLPAADRNVR